MEHDFTNKIKKIIKEDFTDLSDEIYKQSEILNYINLKTISANKGSKSRGSFANLYAIYVITEDYLNKNFDKNNKYADYEGAVFSNLLKRQRELPFGAKLQNHALNQRMNQEFKKLFPTCEYVPIIRVSETKRYWINENLLKFKIVGKKVNIAKSVIKIIDKYIEIKKQSLDNFIATCEKLKNITYTKTENIKEFIVSLLAPNIDARIFEIVSYAILKYYYSEQIIYFGFEKEKIEENNLKLYKTGRTNANDGGIDFVMQPLGRFFQVTETLDFKKYFLDIDKIEKYPITFVIKSEQSKKEILNIIREKAKKQYSINAVVKKYMNCIEEIINIPVLKKKLKIAIKNGYLNEILHEIIIQSKIESNYDK